MNTGSYGYGIIYDTGIKRIREVFGWDTGFFDLVNVLCGYGKNGPIREKYIKFSYDTVFGYEIQGNPILTGKVDTGFFPCGYGKTAPCVNRTQNIGREFSRSIQYKVFR